jgi:hypothetical protein
LVSTFTAIEGGNTSKWITSLAFSLSSWQTVSDRSSYNSSILTMSVGLADGTVALWHTLPYSSSSSEFVSTAPWPSLTNHKQTITTLTFQASGRLRLPLGGMSPPVTGIAFASSSSLPLSTSRIGILRGAHLQVAHLEFDVNDTKASNSSSRTVADSKRSDAPIPVATTSSSTITCRCTHMETIMAAHSYSSNRNNSNNTNSVVGGSSPLCGITWSHDAHTIVTVAFDGSFVVWTITPHGTTSRDNVVDSVHAWWPHKQSIDNVSSKDDSDSTGSPVTRLPLQKVARLLTVERDPTYDAPRKKNRPIASPQLQTSITNTLVTSSPSIASVSCVNGEWCGGGEIVGLEGDDVATTSWVASSWQVNMMGISSTPDGLLLVGMRGISGGELGIDNRNQEQHVLTRAIVWPFPLSFLPINNQIRSSTKSVLSSLSSSSSSTALVPSSSTTSSGGGSSLPPLLPWPMPPVPSVGPAPFPIMRDMEGRRAAIEWSLARILRAFDIAVRNKMNSQQRPPWLSSSFSSSIPSCMIFPWNIREALISVRPRFVPTLLPPGVTSPSLRATVAAHSTPLALPAPSPISTTGSSSSTMMPPSSPSMPLLSPMRGPSALMNGTLPPLSLLTSSTSTSAPSSSSLLSSSSSISSTNSIDTSTSTSSLVNSISSSTTATTGIADDDETPMSLVRAPVKRPKLAFAKSVASIGTSSTTVSTTVVTAGITAPSSATGGGAVKKSITTPLKQSSSTTPPTPTPTPTPSTSTSTVAMTTTTTAAVTINGTPPTIASTSLALLTPNRVTTTSSGSGRSPSLSATAAPSASTALTTTTPTSGNRRSEGGRSLLVLSIIRSWTKMAKACEDRVRSLVTPSRVEDDNNDVIWTRIMESAHLLRFANQVYATGNIITLCLIFLSTCESLK